jgi:probable FeS assembly SUF system protein SufT
MGTPFNYNEPITAQRDCPAVLIPEGTNITIPKGTTLFITQALGGSVTVHVQGNLARIAGPDLDALGMQAQSLPAQSAPHPADGSVDEATLWDQLRTCYDPEIPVNIVDLGLIYSCRVVPLPEGGNRVEINMTLTAPGCGMGPFLVEDVRQKVLDIPNVTEADIALVFDPPWNSSMMSDVARLETGLLY